MNFSEKITGGDMTKEMKAFQSRAERLPEDYKAAWEKIKLNLWTHSDHSNQKSRINTSISAG
jgi:DNA-binding ferritin-like protein (Dps family)